MSQMVQDGIFMNKLDVQNASVSEAVQQNAKGTHKLSLEYFSPFTGLMRKFPLPFSLSLILMWFTGAEYISRLFG